MPDAAFEATQRDWLGPIQQISHSANIQTRLFVADSITRSKEIQPYIAAQGYQRPSEQALAKCDVLIISGANCPDRGISESNIGKEVIHIYQAAICAGVTTVVASCFAAHAILEGHFGIQRQRVLDAQQQPSRLHGVFPHRLTQAGQSHFLTQGLPSTIHAPYSRSNGTPWEGLHRHLAIDILLESEAPLLGNAYPEAHLVASRDGRFIGVQGHPEYQPLALFREWRRDLLLALKNDDLLPALPQNYFTERGIAIVAKYTNRQIERKKSGQDIEYLPSEVIQDHIRAEWLGSWDVLLKRILFSTQQ